MLARPALHLSTWTWTTPSVSPALEVPCWTRPIRALEDPSPLGFVRASPASGWLRVGAPRLDVCETEDAALLMTLEPTWLGLGSWRVLDAEERQIGSILGVHLLDDQGFRFATLQPGRAPRRVLRGLGGTSWAWLELQADGASLLHFAPDLDANPFLRMVILGACVLQDPRP